MPFTSFPPEIHSKIVEFVGENDDARHVCAISLVSKYFYEIACPRLYRAVFVAGRDRVGVLARTLLAKPNIAQHIHHLFLSDTGRGGPLVGVEDIPDVAFELPRTQQARIERRQRLQAWLATREEHLLAFKRMVHDILSIVAPQLHTLTILQYAPCEPHLNILRDAFEVPFPQLRELTLRGSYPDFGRSDAWPVLERLHMAAADSAVCEPMASLTAISNHPHLTHIRITQARMFDPSFLKLIFGLGGIEQFPLREPPPPCLPPSLRRFIVQPDEGEPKLPLQDQTQMMQKLTDIAHAVDMFCLVAPESNPPYPSERATNEWRDRMAGGEGCWTW
ncbi:hypothetical protein BD410DRAFT_41151 [Rickenella mellea]|uniref:Uncharacterized protein n=1 Tax=Rickenella mellea TaxID=50990 RepID=A0A4R5XF57_9AGAM|nr:hypothetical protein BD410DRAFT_41151 [Rickenella mellea]